MIYDLSNPVDLEKFKMRCNHLAVKKERVDLSVKHPRRSASQNRYEHLLFSAFAMETGYTRDEVKQVIFKQVVNPELFYDGESEIEGVSIQKWRSTADLDTAEKTEAINRFLNYSAQNHGLRLPEPGDLAYLNEIEKEASKPSNKEHL